VLLALPSAARAQRVTYERYQAMTEDAKAALARRYARQVGRYHRVTLRTYLVHCDAGAEQAVRMAVLMDEFYKCFSSIFRRGFRDRKRPYLYVLSDRESYGQAIMSFTDGSVSGTGSAGMFVLSGKKSALFGMMSEDEAKMTRVLFHEGTHQLLYSYTGRWLPVWFQEGAATNFENWEVTRSTDNNVANTLHVSTRAADVARIYPNQGFVPFAQLAAMPDQVWHSALDPGANYASAWVAVNFLLSTKGGQTFFSRLLSGFRAARQREKVLPQMTAQEIERHVNRYVEKVVLPHVQHGRNVLQLIQSEKEDEARAAAVVMAKQHPGNKEAAFYTAWLDGRAGGERAGTSAAAIRALERQGFAHPELLFALADIAARRGDAKRAAHCARQMLLKNSRHEGAKAILAGARAGVGPPLK
jgi:hypothetical protein